MTGLTPARWSNERQETAGAVADGLLHQYQVVLWASPRWI